jgi:hypothetical protein
VEILQAGHIERPDVAPDRVGKSPWRRLEVYTGLHEVGAYGVVVHFAAAQSQNAQNSQSRLEGYAENTSGKGGMMVVLVIILVPLIALAIWAAMFDLKRRRRRAPLTSHDIGSAARRARANADTRGGGPGVDL